MTFSIVAADPSAREVGFAIASCCWDAGQVCLAQAELGAIASQAHGNLAFLSSYIERLSRKETLPDILDAFREADAQIESRQIGMVSFEGASLSFTGANCPPWAGHKMGDGYACQGNILAGPGVVDAMGEAFEAGRGALFERLFAALTAGDDAGGDARGRQSARLCVKKKGHGPVGTDSLIDITIEDHEHPVREMARILAVRRTLAEILHRLRRFDEAADADRPAILTRLRTFLEDKRDCRYLDWWETLARKYLELGDLDHAASVFREFVAIQPAMAPVLKAEIDRGGLPHAIAARLLPHLSTRRSGVQDHPLGTEDPA